MATERYKRFVILHSNDMHGDFLAESKGAEGKLIGGLSLLSGYVNAVRRQEKNVLYAIAGDMVQGSLIDSEYKGISTIEIMNFIAPDVVTLGNHELDYGLPHLLFLEKMANFPVVNANLYIEKYHKRLMQPFLVRTLDGFDIMFIGIITDAVLKSLAMDNNIATFVCLEDAAAEVGRICNAYKDQDIDLTILLTHIGFDADKELAALLDPAWGVDMIIGGHSHTVLDQPAVVNNILITQAGVGTDQIGRFDILVDDVTNRIAEWKWQLIPVDQDLAQPDAELQKFIDSFKDQVDRKYSTLITRLTRRLTHPRREVETELGNLLADIFASRAGVDICFLGSGSVRGPGGDVAMGPVVTLRDIKTTFPYDDCMYRCSVTGAQLWDMFNHIMRPENRDGEGECFQVNRGIQAIYSDGQHALQALNIAGSPVQRDKPYSITLQGYHHKNVEQNLGISAADLTALAGTTVVSTSMQDILEEYLRAHQNLDSQVEGRLVYLP